MHRSGTSLLTGSLEAAGLYLGKVNHSAPFNRKGNKENESIRSFHNELLAKNGASWDRPPKGQVRWERSDEERARSLVEPYVRADRPWGFKDPRTLWMVEGWLRLLPSARIVGVFRHPSLVARSLAARTGDLTIGTRDGLRLWCAYNAELLRLHRKYRFPLVHFNSGGAFEKDFIAPLTAFARSIGLSGRLDRFFDGGLVHQTERWPGGDAPGPIPLPATGLAGPGRRLATALRSLRPPHDPRPEPARAPRDRGRRHVQDPGDGGSRVASRQSRSTSRRTAWNRALSASSDCRAAMARACRCIPPRSEAGMASALIAARPRESESGSASRQFRS